MENNNEEQKKQSYLECERLWVFLVLTVVGGYFGAYTYVLRGGVFCNAQTANLIFMAINLGNGDFSGAAYYLIPMGAYLLGTMFSEVLPSKIKWKFHLRWDTILVGIEILTVILLGFLPEEAPFQISQITLTFIASMQYNTFRQAEHVPMATVFCTNNLRQVGIYVVKWLRKREKEAFIRVIYYIGTLAAFLCGCVLSVFFCSLFAGKAIWGAALLLTVVFVALLHADLTKEKNQLDRIPSGH